MKCAYCNNEMIEGFIPCIRGGLTWSPKYKSQTNFIETYLHNKNKKEGFDIAKRSRYYLHPTTRPETEAWYCPECDLVVIDCKQEEG